MTDPTPLDVAHAAMEAEPTDDKARLSFFERLGDCELFLLLTEEAKNENISPELFEVADGKFVLAFDREERLAQFVGQPAPYAALSGRILAMMLAGQGIGLGLNLEVAPSSILIPSEALAWLQQTLEHVPDEVEARVDAFTPPAGLPDHLITSLDTKLSTAQGLATTAYLVGVTYPGGGQGHLLGFVGAIEDAQGALAKAASEALTFSGVDAGAMDVGFFDAGDPVTAKLETVGLKFDLPQVQTSEMARPAPGRDPDKPPRLK
ncbi:hypothetical protein TRL7639_01158 [Falsiruegeria litorea R37]|uniref:Uncharacterized protein n=1 Tax=Falsiruegeria litorea R37 TaxID=1200284 RepID=A0A1Y5RZM2_9RHOB|nr:SseB family protein [Falsiruegeria litorea]SLN29069.1 hypothetical protein TRL7639_01158 [Falsiruegeria litorea R37]